MDASFKVGGLGPILGVSPEEAAMNLSLLALIPALVMPIAASDPAPFLSCIARPGEARDSPIRFYCEAFGFAEASKTIKGKRGSWEERKP